MTFSSPVFLFLFLPFFLAGYYLIRKDFRNIYILAGSVIFYAWGEPRFLLILIISAFLNYFLGLMADPGAGAKLRKTAVFLCVIMNLGLLFTYKYLMFFMENLQLLTGAKWAIPQITLPIGISFFTFQGMSYVLDVYRGQARTQRNPLKLILYIVMFPQLIAGPIVRYRDISEQIEHREVGLSQTGEGIERFIVGLSKKMILANTLGAVADAVFALQPENLAISEAWLGAVCYAMQIYFDFSGYSDMAIGMGKMLGFRFMENFRYPYMASSVKEFWRRWHISLSEWFRDYLYFPMGGSRKGNVYLHLAVVFLATGIWHGATWNFVIWGIWHGFFRIAEYALEKKAKVTIRGLGGWVYTMLVVLIGWVFFRADSLAYAWRYLLRMFGILQPTFIRYSFGWFFTPKAAALLAAACVTSVLPGVKGVSAGVKRITECRWGKVIARIGLVLLFWYSMALVMTSTYNPFIYFRF